MNDKNDFLQKMFQQLSETPLSEDFRLRMMQQIKAEEARQKKRNERWAWTALITLSLCIFGIGALAIFYLDVPKFSLSISMQALETLPFYIYITFLALLLLLGDHFIRRKYYEKHSKQ